MIRFQFLGDSFYGEWRDRLNLPTTAEQDAACLFLETKGRRFLVDYGYENAEAIAKSYPEFARWGKVGRA